jgi:LmbE family N-acetylglucosaminyl deacetylase
MRRLRVAGALVLAAAPLLLASGLAAPPAEQAGLAAPLTPIPQDQGASGLGLALRRLGVGARVLYVTAHPDDEHNGVLVRLSRGLGLRTALLTLTRGEGGQNAIGPELFDALGVLRTEELAALHRFDAVEQYFARAYEFGYSFSVEESLERWGHEETLGDVVRVVRAFRPDVILTLPLEAPGGGQHHQAAAQLAREAFRAAADPARYPGQLAQGLRPWQARKIYQGGTGGGREGVPATSVVLRTGLFDPLLGVSWQQLGSLARASHRSQGSGQLVASPNEGEGVYALVDSEPAAAEGERDILDGIDVSLVGLSRLAGAEGQQARSLTLQLEALQAQLEAARAAFDPRAPQKALPPLVAALTLVRSTAETLRSWPAPARDELRERLDDERREVEAAIALAQGVVLEVVADDGEVTRGQTLELTSSVWNRGVDPIVVEELTLTAPPGWDVRRLAGEPGRLEAGGRLTLKHAVTVGGRARYSGPYWKRRAGTDRLELEVPEHETLPWSPPELAATVQYGTLGVSASLHAPAITRSVGRWVGGERRATVGVVPALSLRCVPERMLLPLPAGGPRELRVLVKNNLKGEASPVLRLELPAGWTASPSSQTLPLRFEGDEATARFRVTAPTPLQPGETELRAVAVLDGQEHAEGVQTIAYHHVHDRQLARRAATRLSAVPVRAAPGIVVGYVMGPGDGVADAIRELGPRLSLLSADELALGDLSRYSTIVTGIRAYETRGDLRAHHDRLMRFVRDGGHLVVQYNREAFNWLAAPPRDAGAASRPRPDSPFAPYPASVTPERVSDETARIQVLVPVHALLARPNRIGASDWDGWVQERAIQLLDARDPRYRELLASEDPFPKNPGVKKGLLVEAGVGRGTWTYVGLVLFRQVAAGTPGGYRLLANLVSRPRAR